MPLMVSISGIRGVIGETLTPATAVQYAAAFAQYCRRRSGGKPTIAVGYDGRVTGSMITNIVSSTLAAAGADVRLLGICPTPTVQLAVEKGGAAGGIAVTASHNPMEWNGMKFVAPTGMFLDAEENQEFWSLAEEPPRYASWREVGTTTEDGSWIAKHIESVLTLPFLRPALVRRRQFRVVLDCVNASGGVIVPQLLAELGCTVIGMNCDVSGIFQHTPEPIPENLTALAAAVRDEKADVGIAIDPDGDRLVLITEEGIPYSEEYTIASAVKFVLGKIPPPRGTSHTVVVNLSTTRAVDDIARQAGAQVVRTAVGEINVARKMKELGAIIGGEGSGGVILPAVHLGRDAMVGIGLILQLLAEHGGTLSSLKASLPQYAIAKGKIALGTASPDAILRRIAAEQQNSARVTTGDGVKLDYPDFWVHLRKSNTEPIVRIIAEGTTPEHARGLVEKFTGLITSTLG
jgi:phosphomannomutase